MPETAIAAVSAITASELRGEDFDLSGLPAPTLEAGTSGRRAVVEITNLGASERQTSGGFDVNVVRSPGFGDASVPLAFQLGGPVASPLAELAREGGLTDYVYINGVVTTSAGAATGNFVPGSLDTRTRLLPGALNGLLDRGSSLLGNDSTNPELAQIAEYLNRLDANVKAGDVATISAIYESDAAAVDASFRRGDFSIESRTYERLAALRPVLFGPSPLEGAPRLGNVLAGFGILSLTGAIGGIAGVGAFGFLANAGVRASIALPASGQIANLTDQSLRNIAYTATDGYAGQSGINGLELGFATALPLALYGGAKGFEKLENAIVVRASRFRSPLGGPGGPTLNSAEKFAPTGVAEFDELISTSAKAQKVIRGLERRGVIVIDDPSVLSPRALANTFKNKQGQITVAFDGTKASFLDLIHEARHVAQIQRVDAAGVLGRKELFSGKFIDFAEQGAYQYELRLAKSYKFSDAYTGQVRERADFFTSRSFAEKVRRSPTTRAIANALEPRIRF